MTADELEALVAKATQGPWEVDSEYDNDACYSGGGACGTGFKNFFIGADIDGKWQTLLDTQNSDHKLIEEEYDEDGKNSWDSIGWANAELIAALVNNAPRLIEALRASEWRGMDSAPHDENILAAVKVRHKDGRTWWEMHTIVIDSETGEITPDNDAGWGHDDYTHWRPLPAHPATEAGE